MAEKNSDFITNVKTANDNLNEKVKDLFELSVQLKEYSRVLKQRSDEINQRLQSCVNMKRAA